MKKYFSLGELLVDYRELNSRTQSDVATMLEVDVRTVARWENNESLIKTDKEDIVVEKTFIPYQVIHNLNAAVPMPIYYDFKIRKYSLTGAAAELPDAEWFRSKMNATSPRVRTIKKTEDAKVISRYHRFLYNTEKPVKESLILEAARVFPELNLIILDSAGYYAGHSVVFPIADSTFQKMKDREMVEGEIRETHLVNYKTFHPAIFYGYSVYADCNENFYFLIATLIRFLKKQFKDDYIFSGLLVRYDALDLLEKGGLKKIWEDKEEQKKLGMLSPPTFLEGQFNQIFLGD